MITDDERRVAARRLREAASHYETMGRGVDFYPVESALGLKPAGETAYAPESVRSLADLIEPPTRCPHYMYPCCRTDAGGDYIDRDALLALADEIQMDGADSLDEDWCKDLLYEYARRIRDALCGE